MSDTSRSRTRHAMARAEDVLAANGWTVLRRHTYAGHEIFASRAVNASRVWFARIRSRSAVLHGGDLDHAFDRKLTKSGPEQSALAFVAMAERDARGAT